MFSLSVFASARLLNTELQDQVEEWRQQIERCHRIGADDAEAAERAVLALSKHVGLVLIIINKEPTVWSNKYLNHFFIFCCLNFQKIKKLFISYNLKITMQKVLQENKLRSPTAGRRSSRSSAAKHPPSAAKESRHRERETPSAPKEAKRETPSTAKEARQKERETPSTEQRKGYYTLPVTLYSYHLNWKKNFEIFQNLKKKREKSCEFLLNQQWLPYQYTEMLLYGYCHSVYNTITYNYIVSYEISIRR